MLSASAVIAGSPNADKASRVDHLSGVEGGPLAILDPEGAQLALTLSYMLRDELSVHVRPGGDPPQDVKVFPVFDVHVVCKKSCPFESHLPIVGCQDPDCLSSSDDCASNQRRLGEREQLARLDQHANRV